MGQLSSRLSDPLCDCVLHAEYGGKGGDTGAEQKARVRCVVLLRNSVGLGREIGVSLFDKDSNRRGVVAV